MVVVPNSAFRQVTNLSKEWSRAVVDIPVAAGEDLQLASHLLRFYEPTTTIDAERRAHDAPAVHPSPARLLA